MRIGSSSPGEGGSDQKSPNPHLEKFRKKLKIKFVTCWSHNEARNVFDIFCENFQMAKSLHERGHGIIYMKNRCTKLSCNAIKLNDPFRATNCENTIFNSAIKDIGIGFSDLCWFVSIFHYTKGTYPFRATPIPLSRNDFENEQKTYKN